MPDHSQVELIKSFLPVRPNFARPDLTPCLTILGTLKVSVTTAFAIKLEFSGERKLFFLSPELIALPLIAVGLLDTTDFITFPLYFAVA